MTRALTALGRIAGGLLDALLSSIFGAMLLLAVAQIILRNAFSYSLLWGDGVLRLLVLWLAMAGAIAATRSDRHIRIAVLDRFVPAGALGVLWRILDAFAAGVCGLLAWHSGRFVMDAYRYGDTLLGDVPAWIPQAIMPVGFGLMAVMFAVRTLLGRSSTTAGPQAAGLASAEDSSDEQAGTDR